MLADRFDPDLLLDPDLLDDIAFPAIPNAVSTNAEPQSGLFDCCGKGGGIGGKGGTGGGTGGMPGTGGIIGAPPCI